MDKSTAPNHLFPKKNKSNRKDEQRYRSLTNIINIFLNCKVTHEDKRQSHSKKKKTSHVNILSLKQE